MHLTIIKNEHTVPKIFSIHGNETLLFFQNRLEIKINRGPNNWNKPIVRFVPDCQLPKTLKAGELTPFLWDPQEFTKWVELERPITVLSISDSPETDEVIKIIVCEDSV